MADLTKGYVRPFRKDYWVRIARVLHAFPFSLEDECMRTALVNALADEIEKNNGLFNRNAFLLTCGVLDAPD